MAPYEAFEQDVEINGRTVLTVVKGALDGSLTCIVSECSKMPGCSHKNSQLLARHNSKRC